MGLKIITISLSLCVLLLVIELIRKEKLTFKYAFGWLIVSLAAIVLSIFDQLLFQAAHVLGFQLPSNFIFFTLLTIFVFLAVVLTVFLCQQNNRNDTMAQKIAMLEFEIEQLKKEINASAQRK